MTRTSPAERVLNRILDLPEQARVEIFQSLLEMRAQELGIDQPYVDPLVGSYEAAG
jgi:hypothetical protein